MRAAFGEQGKTPYPLGNQKAGLIDVDNGNLELGARLTAVQAVKATRGGRRQSRVNAPPRFRAGAWPPQGQGNHEKDAG